ncbi:MAG: hypothetical protein ACKO1M_07760, partial [Planctomycetota bacterium]
MSPSAGSPRGDRFWHRTGADSELMRLAGSQCDGTATEADCRRLDELLAEPESLAGYLAVMEQHATFLWRQRWRQGMGLPPFTDDSPAGEGASRGVRGGLAGSPARHERPAGRGRSAAMVAIDGIHAMVRWLARPATASFLIAGVFLASALGLVAVISLDTRRADREAAFASGQLAVAFVAGIHEASWAGKQQSFHAAQGLRVGDTIDLAGGLVELSFVSGAKVVVQGPARFEATARDAGRLHAGRLTALVKAGGAETQTAAGLFTVITPNAVVTDLGT